MAFQVGEPDDGVIGEINVTPLVDVMLVLLIIFMIAAPMLHQGIEVDLPHARAQALPVRGEDPLVVSLSRDGIVYLQETPIHPSQLADRLLPMVQARGEEAVYLKADRGVPYGQVVDLLEVLRRGGIVNVGMVTQFPDAGETP